MEAKAWEINIVIGRNYLKSSC